MADLVPIDEAIADFEEKAAEAAVFGNQDKLTEIETRLEDLRARQEFGELWFISL